MDFDWSVLITDAGAVAAVTVIVQGVKDLPFLKKIPTRILTYLATLAVLFPAYGFTVGLSAANAGLILLRSILLSLSANGGFDAVKNAVNAVSSGNGSSARK